MKKAMLFAALIAAGFSSFASSVPAAPVSKAPFTNVQSALPMRECSFSAKFTVSFFGQSAEMTCSSSSPSCDEAVNAVAACLKRAKNKILDAVGL